MDYARNSTEKGGQSVSSGSKAANHNETPTDKTRLARAPLGTSGPNPFFREKGGDSKFPETA